MKKFALVLVAIMFATVSIVGISAQAAQKPQVAYLVVPMELTDADGSVYSSKGAIIEGDYSNWDEKKNLQVLDEGKTNVPLIKNQKYLLRLLAPEMDTPVYFYINGEVCNSYFAFSKYLGSGRWLNTFRAGSESQQPTGFTAPHEVKWPK